MNPIAIFKILNLIITGISAAYKIAKIIKNFKWDLNISKYKRLLS